MGKDNEKGAIVVEATVALRKSNLKEKLKGEITVKYEHKQMWDGKRMRKKLQEKRLKAVQRLISASLLPGYPNGVADPLQTICHWDKSF